MNVGVESSFASNDRHRKEQEPIKGMGVPWVCPSSGHYGQPNWESFPSRRVNVEGRASRTSSDGKEAGRQDGRTQEAQKDGGRDEVIGHFVASHRTQPLPVDVETFLQLTADKTHRD